MRQFKLRVLPFQCFKIFILFVSELRIRLKTQLYSCLLSYSWLEEFVCDFKTATFSFDLVDFRRVIVWSVVLERFQLCEEKKEEEKFSYLRQI